MAADATSKFQNPDFMLITQPPDFHPQIVVSPAHDGLHLWHFMVASSIAGSIEHMAMFPVDIVKTQIQALGSCPIKSASVREALRSIMKTESAKRLYRGIGAMAMGAVSKLGPLINTCMSKV